MAKKHWHVRAMDPKGEEEKQLLDTGRWGHFVVQLSNTAFLYLFVVYGISGAALDPVKMMQNEALL